MKNGLWKLVVLGMAACGGCFLWEEPKTQVVPTAPFAAPPPDRVSHVTVSPASMQTAARVDWLGRKIIAANPGIGLKPVISAIGDPRPAILHHVDQVGTSRLIVTEGLIQRCRNEGELAAVLCSELARMVAEREALASLDSRDPERRPPIRVPVGTDAGGTFGSPDGTQLAELAKYAPKRRANAAPPLPPDPEELAREYLQKAGYRAADYDAVVPLLDEARKNLVWEKQLKNRVQKTPLLR
ncbi:MAG: hypothetical protein KatS3mg105_0787 [Gemmatales bacterium]|nr:MAG: hypothetical protein KatS3mg105_0787 [Gemmatales bacterium]